MAYQPIENHGLIGNMRTCALISKNGSIDWFCYPHFDSPSIFGGILDDEIGGSFSIHPTAQDDVTYKQYYWPDTNILVTRFLTSSGIAEVVDYMPVSGDSKPASMLIRVVSVLQGDVQLKMHCLPAFDYARDKHTIEIVDDSAIFTASDSEIQMRLYTDLDSDLSVDHNGVTAEFTLSENTSTYFIFCEDHAEANKVIEDGDLDTLFEQTVSYWHKWLSQCTYEGRWREVIYRSALALKLMTFEPTGAIIASPTTSLPEGIGGERNWDYRYVWIRDAAFTVYAFLRIGFTQEAEAFIDWLSTICYNSGKDGVPLQPMYGIDGREELEEISLDHLAGYKDSKPVRIGNGAYEQVQMDVFGELIDGIYLYNKYGSFISHQLWDKLRDIAEWICDNWQKEDLSIWEIRDTKGKFTYSRVMLWVALDRMLRLANKRSFPANRDRWEKVRDQIYDEIMQSGWHDERQAFVQRYDANALDAANLIMPLVFFVAPDDPHMLKTIEAIRKPIDSGGLSFGNMVYRYNVKESPDGLEGEEGMFNMCTFWLIEALTRSQQVDDARIIFEQMLTNANHLGLYAEQVGHRGEALGNFPQAFTHLSLISAAFNLDRALGGYQQRI